MEAGIWPILGSFLNFRSNSSEANGSNKPVPLINPPMEQLTTRCPRGTVCCSPGMVSHAHKGWSLPPSAWSPHLGPRKWRKMTESGLPEPAGPQSLEWLHQNHLRSLLKAVMPKFCFQSSGCEPWLYIRITWGALKKKKKNPCPGPIPRDADLMGWGGAQALVFFSKAPQVTLMCSQGWDPLILQPVYRSQDKTIQWGRRADF